MTYKRGKYIRFTLFKVSYFNIDLLPYTWLDLCYCCSSVSYLFVCWFFSFSLTSSSSFSSSSSSSPQPHSLTPLCIPAVSLVAVKLFAFTIQCYMFVILHFEDPISKTSTFTTSCFLFLLQFYPCGVRLPTPPHARPRPPTPAHPIALR